MDHFGVSLMILLSFFCTVSGTTDPCQHHGIINQARRSSNATVDDPDLDICDLYLDKGWYRFTSYTGGQIPTSCVQPYHCSTQVPVWMNGTLPEGDEMVDRTGCANLGVPNDCCTIPIDMRVKRCTGSSGVFYVYELQPTYYCPMAYCAGNLPLCPEGEVYDNFHKSCIETRPIVPCDFEGHGFCEWLQERDDELNWVKTTGEHASESILPDVDHTNGTASGSYAFIMSSTSNQPGDMARLISPIIVPSKTDACNITFYYQVEGLVAGTLRVFMKGYHGSSRSLLWTSPENRLTTWRETVVSLVDSDPFQVIIEGVIGTHEQSAIALDGISFSLGCSSDVDGAVRLVDGDRFGEGRVEIFYDHEWGTICDRGWTQTNGDVICSQLGYTSALPSQQHYPAPASTPIHLDEVSCRSTNVTKISSCDHSRWGHYHPDCTHEKDVSVACTGQWYECSDTEFICSNTICVPPEVRCDFTNDCGDNSDEQGCDDYPARCDFQDDFCGWSDNGDWVRTSGDESTSPDAPPTDHQTRSGGKYLLLTSEYADSRSAVLNLPEYYLSTKGDCKILFHYYMTTSSVELRLRLETNNNQETPVGMAITSGRHWIREEFMVPVNTIFQVSFEGLLQSSNTGVIAIDDVTLTPSCNRTQLEAPKVKDDPTPVPKNDGLSASGTMVIIAVCTILPLVLLVTAAALCYLKRKQDSYNNARAAVHELEQRSGHTNPSYEHQYDYIHQTGTHVQGAQANGTTVTFQNLQRCHEVNAIEKQKQMPGDDPPCAGKVVPKGLTVNIDSSGYAFLQKSTMDPACNTRLGTELDKAYTDPALCRFLQNNGFSEFADMFNGLTLSFLRTATEKDLMNHGIPLAIAVSVLNKLHEPLRQENEYTTLNVDTVRSSSPQAAKPIANVDV